MTRYAHATYCDDIRQELGGKLTLVGVYSGSLLVPSFPVILPKLCLVLQIVTAADSPLKELKIRVLMDEAVIAEGELAVGDLEAGFAAMASERDSDDSTPEADRRFLLGAHFIFSPIKFDGPGAIRVRIDTENGELKANALRIEQAKAPADEIPAAD